MSAFALIVAGIVSAIEAAIPDVPIHANRVRPIGAAETRAISVRLESSRRDPTGTLAASDWQTIIVVECAARTGTGSDPAAAIDSLLASAYAAVLGVPLSLPDVLDLDAEPEIGWDFDAGETPLVSAAFRLSVRHRTQANTLTPWSA